MRYYISFIIFVLSSSAAMSQEKLCIEKRSPFPSQNRTKFEHIINEISSISGLSNNIAIIECDFYDEKIGSFKANDLDRIWDGNYVIFSPRWMQEVAGGNENFKKFLMAHELGHFVRQHLPFKDQSKTQRKMELEADVFAGCQLAKMEVNLYEIENILKRIRDNPGDSELYPSAVESISEITKQYRTCGGNPDTLIITIERPDRTKSEKN